MISALLLLFCNLFSEHASQLIMSSSPSSLKSMALCLRLNNCSTGCDTGHLSNQERCLSMIHSYGGCFERMSCMFLVVGDCTVCDSIRSFGKQCGSNSFN
mmetsp:Transcript_125634/g.367021  ORF Transcript_125634/g.367021 Transcript_125634/m.367021 type:complete len:100 (+) Transcript_125634:465-764(+)